ncbi:MAG: UDP-N-acetylmuramate dehydrogenase [Saprospiraceae bacterium]|nr:UDP-N-acetylmuramate dehydrogenase [Saprospiraceae bacterium]
MSVRVIEHQDLQQYHTFGLRAEASYFAEVHSQAELSEVLKLPHQRLILGGGSNLFFTRNYPGLIIRNAIGGIQVIAESQEHVIVEAGGGVVWHELVQWTIQHNYGGLENLSLIPGTVGAAPIQNIGAYGVEFDTVFYQLEGIELETGIKRTFTRTDCDFGYRDSIFKRDLKGKYIVTSVQIRLTLDNHPLSLNYGDIRNVLLERGIAEPGIRDVSEAVIEIRSSKLPDPSVIGNAGSFFKNPIVTRSFYEGMLADYPDMPSYAAGEERCKIPAAWLIERAGWKGYRIGDAGVYPKHALVLVNYGHATGSQMYHLAQAIQQSILDIFGIPLESEVNMI